MTSLDDLLALLPDNTDGDISAADMRTIVTELWNTGAAVEARVTALEADTRGGGGGVSVTGRWQVNPTAGAEPGGKQLTASSGELALATWLRFDPVDMNNNDLTAALLAATDLLGQQQADAGSWARWTVSAAAVDHGTYVEVPVNYVDGDGSIATAGWQQAIVVIYAAVP